ncbi:MAG TPA: hypothetical protein VHV79_00085 [Mycobacteriales bacterium]|nr:hypothetical protein [Mycobacteriales bacterium]
MTETFVLHLRSGPLADGEIHGVVEVVATGARHVVGAFDELRSVLIESSRQSPTPGSTPAARKRETSS